MKAARVPDDVGERCLPAPPRFPAKAGTSCRKRRAPRQRDPRLRGGSQQGQAETLHPHVRPFGHRVTLTAASVGRQGRQCSARFPRECPGRMGALRRVWGGGQGGSWMHPTRVLVAVNRRAAPQGRTAARALRGKPISADALRPALEGENKRLGQPVGVGGALATALRSYVRAGQPIKPTLKWQLKGVTISRIVFVQFDFELRPISRHSHQQNDAL